MSEESDHRNAAVANHPFMVPKPFTGFKPVSCAELVAMNFDHPPNEIADYEPDEYWHYQKRLNYDIDLFEKITRPLGALMLDELDERDVCMSFANDISQIIRAGMMLEGPGLPISKASIKTLPHVRCVYFINEKTGPNWSSWMRVYVGKAVDLHARWNDKATHHHFDRACEAECRLTWFPVEYGTENLIEAAMIYKLKPPWNTRQ